MPSTLKKLLIGIGRLIGQITVLALAATLFIAPVTAILMASFYISFTLVHGAGEFLGFVIFCVLVGLSGWYVTPHVQPQISNAISALLRSEEEEAVHRSLKNSLETHLAGRRTKAAPEDLIEAFGVLMERYPTAIWIHRSCHSRFREACWQKDGGSPRMMPLPPVSDQPDDVPLRLGVALNIPLRGREGRVTS